MKRILLTSAVAASIAAFSVSAATFQATLSVNNAINVTEDVPLDFGVFSGSFSDTATELASITLGPTTGYGAVSYAVGTSADANLIVVTPGTAGQFSVTGVPAFAPLTVSVGDDTAGTAGSAMTLGSPASTGDLIVDGWAAEVITGSSPGASMDLDTTAQTQNADASGNFTFALGATLTTDPAGNAAAAGEAYPDVSFTGSYFVDVSY
jgi:hypothetical protein